MKAPVDYMDDEQKRRGIGDFLFYPVAPLLIGILFCGAIYGFDILNPENVSWLLKGDALQAYTGWEFFRSTPWSFPVIGLSPNFGMEVSNSIVYTDSNPLLAIFFKLFTNQLPDNFQYFGIWLFACCTLSALFIYKIVTLFVDSKVYALLCVVLVMFNPAWINRVGHLNLMGHFLILAAIYLCLRKSDKKAPALWASLLLLSCTIHFYIAMMAYIMWFSNLATRAFISKSYAKVFLEFFCVISGSLLFMYILGYFSVGNVAVHDGYGQFNNNLLSPLMPSGWSSFLNRFGFNADGFEDFNYWGLGFALVFLAGLLSIRKLCIAPGVRTGLVSLALSMIAFVLISTTNHIQIGSFETTLPLPEFLLSKLSIFRASSRFFWPITYIAIISAVVLAYKSLKIGYASVLILVAILIQVSDIKPGFSKDSFYFFTRTHEVEPLKDSFWVSDIKGYSALRYVPFSNASVNWEALSGVAEKNGMKTDAVYLARVGDYESYLLNNKVQEGLFTGMYDDHTVYVLSEYFLDKVKLKRDDVVCRIDGMMVLAPGFHGCHDTVRSGGAVQHAYVLAGGWSTFDESGTWNDGNFASIVFKNDPSAKYLRVDYTPFLTEKVRSQRIIAKIDGKVVASFTINSAGTLVIPNAGDKTKQFARVDFEMPDATSPAEQGLSIDGRRLTMLLRDFRLDN